MSERNDTSRNARLENNIRALKVELQAADKIIKRLKKNPQCPDCGGRMTRVQWECQDGSGWLAGWLCLCETNAHGRRIRPPNAGTQRPGASDAPIANQSAPPGSLK